MEKVLINEEHKKFFEQKHRTSDFESWALRQFAHNCMGVPQDGAWTWYDDKLVLDVESDVREYLWLTDNGNLMLERVGDGVDELYVIRSIFY